jgi:hypothetical protein
MPRRWAAGAAVLLVTALGLFVAGDQVSTSAVDTAAQHTVSASTSHGDSLRETSFPSVERASAERTRAVNRVVPITCIALAVTALLFEQWRRRRTVAIRTPWVSLRCSLWRRGPPVLLPNA